MEQNRVNLLRKTSSGLGFMLFAISSTMTILSVMLTIVFANKIDTTATLLLDILISILSLFGVGIIYCRISGTRLDEIIQVKRVRPGTAVPLVFSALAVSFTADYLADLVNGSLGLFGIENGIDLSTNAKSLVEIILGIIAVAIIPPLVEEFVFRGILLGKLRKYGDAFAVFMSSVLFALMHGNIVQIPFTFIVGLVLAFMTVKTESVLPAIVVHFIINFRSELFSTLIDNMLIDGNTLDIIYLVFLFVFFVLGIISSAVLSKRKDFFKLESDGEIPFGQALKISFFSVGNIFFIIHSILTTLQTISLSWFDLSKYIF